MALTAPPQQVTTAPPAGGVTAPAGRAGRLERPGTLRTLISATELKRPRTRVVYYVVLSVTTLLFVLAFVFPLYWMFTGALKSPAEFAQTPPTVVPHTVEPGNYSQAWTQLEIAHFFGNTVLYALGGWAIQLGIAVPVAYSLSKLRPIFGKVVLAGMLASLMLPATALLVPAYLVVSDLPIVHLNLLNTPWALWLPGAANAFNIYVLKRFFDEIDEEILDAARIDGAGRLRVLRSIVLPLSRPVLGVVSIFSIVAIWKDFVWPLLVLQDTQTQTLSVALSRLSIVSQVPPTVMMAGIAITAVPMIVVLLVFQRSIIGGLSAGATKG
jgi:multiple sugar transport system permease protein